MHDRIASQYGVRTMLCRAVEMFYLSRDKMRARSLHLPPTYHLMAIIVMIALNSIFPLKEIILAPYNYLGFTFVLIGTGMSLGGAFMFGKAKTPIIPFKKSTRLLTTGLYRYTRNPMYLGMILVLIGVFILLGSITPFLVIPPFVWLMQRKFVAVEERHLEETFGEQYRAYKQTVRRWI